jgi:hypothetical protein
VVVEDVIDVEDVPQNEESVIVFNDYPEVDVKFNEGEESNEVLTDQDINAPETVIE